MAVNSNDEANFPDKFLLANVQVWKIRKAFANSSSANMKFSKIQLPKMIQPGGVLADPLGGKFGRPSPIKMLNLIAGSYVKEFKNKDITKEIKNKSFGGLFVNTGFNILRKKN